MMDKQIKKWIVKDNHRILGPFTEDTIKEKIVSNTLSPFATASVPGQTFWIFLGAYPQFKDETGRFTSSFSRTITRSKSLLSGTATNIPQENTNTVKISATGSLENSAYEVRDFPYDGTATSSAEKGDKKSFFVGLICVSIFLAGTYAFIKNEILSSSNLKVNTFARAFFDSGNYSKAMKEWSIIKDLRTTDLASFRLLKFQLKNDISQAEKIMNQNSSITISEKKIIQALVEIKSGDLQEAKKNLIKIIEDNLILNNIREASFFNLSLLYAKLADDCSGINKYKKSFFTDRNVSLFSSSFCELQSLTSLSDSQKKNIQKTFEKMSQKKSWEYYQEALLGLAYIQSINGQDVLPIVKKLLDSDPYLTESYYYSIYVDRNIYSWSELLPFCKKVYDSNKDHELFNTLYSYCLARAGDYEPAQKFIKKAVLANSESALVKSVDSYVVNLFDLKEQTALILGDAIRSNSNTLYTLPHILQARFCEANQNWDCAIQHWGYVINNQPNSISGLGGLSYAHYRNDHLTEARAYMERGTLIKQAFLYSPLLFVKKQLETSLETVSINK